MVDPKRLERMEEFCARLAKFLRLNKENARGQDPDKPPPKDPAEFSAMEAALFQSEQNIGLDRQARREWQQIKETIRGFSVPEARYVARRVAELRKGIR